jgi:hypothetical protein
MNSGLNTQAASTVIHRMAPVAAFWRVMNCPCEFRYQSKHKPATARTNSRSIHDAIVCSSHFHVHFSESSQISSQ